MHSVLSYSTYNIPPLTEYIPVLPAKGLDDGGDCRAGHIRLRPASTIVRQWLITWSLSVAQISSRPAWCFRVPLASSSYSTTTHPYSSSSSSSPSSSRQLPLFITWPGAGPGQALYIHVWQHSQSWTASNGLGTKNGPGTFTHQWPTSSGGGVRHRAHRQAQAF